MCSKSVCDVRAVPDQYIQAGRIFNQKIVMYFAGGLSSPEDEAFSSSFTDVYSNIALQVPWFAVLGNHDYGDKCYDQPPGCSPSGELYFSPDHQVGKSRIPCVADVFTIFRLHCLGETNYAPIVIMLMILHCHCRICWWSNVALSLFVTM